MKLTGQETVPSPFRRADTGLTSSGFSFFVPLRLLTSPRSGA